MPDPAHLQVLKQGSNAWNEWRARHEEIVPDLSEANLAEADLNGVDLHSANLRLANLAKASLPWADLYDANLSHANLRAADLRWTNLGEANLQLADLTDANLANTALVQADLSKADLTRANLFRANLSQAILVGTLFDETLMGYTALGGLNLSLSKGLETVHHFRPSSVAIDTVYLSKFQIPEVFLRGTGVPDDFITYMRSLTSSIEFYSCFISYSVRDEEFVTKLYSDLQAENIRCWFAPAEMKIGAKIQQTIDEAIQIYDKLLLILTQDSVNSAWVGREVDMALTRESRQGKTVLFPIRLDDSVMGAEEPWAVDIRRTRHIGDFREWKDRDKYKKAFGQLVRDLTANFALDLARK